MVLIKPTLKIENPDIIRDKKGRFLLVRASLQDEEFCFVNIYAPNDPSLQKTFFNELSNKLRPYSNDNIILGGDFNCPLESVDKTGGKDTNNRRSVIDSINDLRNTLGLVDIWRFHHPSSQRFTWSNSSGKIQCRLDYWLVSKHLVPRTCKTEVKAYHDSDHSPIYVEIQYENSQKKPGPGFWKFNNSLLENEEFVLNLKFFLIHAKEKHSYIDDKRLYWEMVKMEIRDFCIRFAKRLSKNRKTKEMDLLRKLNELNVFLGKNPNDMNLTTEARSVKLELKNLSERKTKGAIIRSRVRWYEHGERNNKYFVNLEKRSHNRKHIAKLKTDKNEYLVEPNKILLEMEHFYKTLYTSQLPEVSTFNEPSKRFLNPEMVPKLNAEQQSICEGLITADECLSILKTFAKNKTPGSDGLTAEFYLCFWNDVVGPLIDCFNDAYQKGEMSISQRRGVISLIPKKNKDNLLLKNWRPISLLNTDYKIATKCIANRLEKVLPTLINSDQTGYVKNRFIGENIRLISDVIDVYEKRNLPGMLLFIDFEKAFDSLEWKFLFEAIDAMNFGPMFQNWIHVFYSNISSCVLNNGFASNFFSLHRGVRQGCPLSGLLFVLAVETLAQSIRQNNNICGLKLNDTEIKLSLYADDITAFILNDSSADHLFNLLSEFGECSGLKMNISKTEGMWLGSLKQNKGKRSPFNISWPEKYVIALGVAFAYDPAVSCRINFEEKIVSLKKTLNRWSARNLTLIGRICIVKTLAISKLVYNTSVLSVSSNICKQVNDICFRFVWKMKPDKIKRHTLIGPLEKGGLNMVDFVMMDKSLKAAWAKRLCEAGDSKWCAAFSLATTHLGGTFLFECNFDIHDLNLPSELPSFYKEILSAWQEIHSTDPSSADEYRNEIIWNNRFIRIDGKPIFFLTWYQKGVVKIRDLLEDGRYVAIMTEFIKEQFEGPVIHGMPWIPGTTQEMIDTFPRLSARQNDIYINTYAKAGTTWTQEIVWQIIHNGKIDYRRLDVRMPWIDGMVHPFPSNPYHVTSPVMIERMFESFPSPRVFKTHLPYDLVPKPSDQATKPRYIYVMRNPKDTAVSYYHHYLSAPSTQNLTWDAFFELFIKGEGPREALGYCCLVTDKIQQTEYKQKLNNNELHEYRDFDKIPRTEYKQKLNNNELHDYRDLDKIQQTEYKQKLNNNELHDYRDFDKIPRTEYKQKLNNNELHDYRDFDKMPRIEYKQKLKTQEYRDYNY
ncbi:hypothetical protein ACROYT_G001243 [Oculina patagonica]